MSESSSNAAVYVLTMDGLPDTSVVLGLRGVEAMSEPYDFEVLVDVPEDEHGEVELPIDVDATIQALDARGSVRMQFHGIVSSAEIVGGTGRMSVYRLHVRPRMWRMTLTEHSRVWVDKKAPEVIEDVLKANGLTGDDYQLSLSKAYPKVEHICQYHESDFDFVSRWMEREGIYYFFEHDGSKEKLTITDHGAIHRPSVDDPVRYFPLTGAEGSTVEAMHTFSRRQQLRPEKVRVADHNYLQPGMEIASDAPVVDGGVGAVVDFGGNLPVPAEARRIARIRAEESIEQYSVFHGRGRVFPLAPGFKFTLEEHPYAPLNGDYLATGVRHRGVNIASPGLLKAHAPEIATDEYGQDAPTYRVEVDAIAADTVFRPARKTPWPRIWGIEMAVIDGPLGDDYAEIDEHGRYHVKIRFDESDLSDGKASCWIRMVQPHAGNPEGFHFPLRKGTEVMLAFVGGDPDRPVIVGSAPDAETPSPVTQSNRTQNVVMTGGRNRIEIEDSDGDQYVSVYSPPENSSIQLGAITGPRHSGHNATLSTDGSGLSHTGGNRDITVGGNQTEDVQGSLTEDYHSNQTTHVFAAFDETIDGGATQTISAGETRTVTGGLTETISGGETRTVNGGQIETVNGSVTRSISASLTLDVGAAVTETVGGSYAQTLGAALSQTITGPMTVTTPATIDITATGGVNWQSDGGFTIIAPGGTTIVDEDQGNEGKFFITLYGFKTGVVGLKREGVNAIACGNVGYKSERAGVKYEDIGFALENEPVSFLVATHTWTTGVLVRTAFKLFG